MSGAADRRAGVGPRDVPYAAPVCEPDPATGRCATCADEAVRARVLRLDDDALARVDVDGEVRTVAVELVDDVRVGDVLLVHAGVAIGRVGPNPQGKP